MRALKDYCKHSTPTCAECAKRRAYHRQYGARNRTAMREASRRYYAANKEAIQTRQRMRTAGVKRVRPPSHKEYQKAWRAANQTRVAAVIKAWNAAHPDKVREYRQRAYSKNKAAFRARDRRRRALEVEAFCGPVDVAALVVEQGGLCYLCSKALGADCSLDHVVPLTRGGSHEQFNAAVAHKACNSKKNAKSLLFAMLALKQGD